MNIINIDIARFTRLTNDEYKALLEHPYSRKSLDSYKRVSNSDWADYSLVDEWLRELNISTGAYKVWKHEEILGASENKWGVFAQALYRTMPKRFFNPCNIEEYKWYPVEGETVALLNALGYKVEYTSIEDDDSSVIAVMFTDGNEC